MATRLPRPMTTTPKATSFCLILRLPASSRVAGTERWSEPLASGNVATKHEVADKAASRDRKPAMTGLGPGHRSVWGVTALLKPTGRRRRRAIDQLDVGGSMVETSIPT